jgi:TonB family protein
MHRCRIFLATVLALAASSPAGAASFWDSRPLRIIQTDELNFPPALLMEGIREGEVRAVLNVDADGRLADCLVTAYTHPALAHEVVSGLKFWKYEPTWERGEPIGTRVAVVFAFHAKGCVLSLSPIDSTTSPTARLLGTPLTVILCKANALDGPLAVAQSVPPRHPGRALRPAQPRGSAVLDFYVDASGRPRMPVVTRATHEAFAVAAVEALLQWQFVPPTRNGTPVVVRVTQQFTFSSDDSGT